MKCETCHQELGEGRYGLSGIHVEGQVAYERCPVGKRLAEEAVNQERIERFKTSRKGKMEVDDE